VAGEDIELAGSAVGVIPGGRPSLGEDLAPGDEVVLVASSGLHANGSSLARMIAARLTDGYRTPLPSGRPFGEALLDPSLIYTGLVAGIQRRGLPVHYLSHITGHGLLKLMRPARELTYRIDVLPAVPEVLGFLVQQAGLDPRSAYSTFNMGAGFAVYCAAGTGAEVVRLAGELGLRAQLAGAVEAGPRRVILEPIDIVYESGDLDLAPRRG
jgi:phosphoribosylformylglycinamidine cyclo-ligase